MILVSENPFGAGGLVARKLRLANGLGAIFVRDNAAPLCALQTWFRVGSRNEHEGKTGIAHLFEHLMFNQTEHLAPGEFDRRLEAIGAETNAATWVDWTYYRETFPSPHLDLVLSLEAERMAHLVVHDPQVESEREVVQNERRLRVEDDVDGFLSEELHRLAFDVHPYRWPTIGWMADIQGITTADARAFYRTFYAPNNATLVLVGAFDPTDAERRIEAHYGGLAPAALPAERTVVEAPLAAPRRAEFEKEVASDRLLLGWRAVGLDHSDQAAVAVAMEIMAGGQSSRLVQRLVIEREIASTVSGWTPEFRDPGLAELRVALQRGHRADEAERLVDEAWGELGARAVDPDELEKAKNRLEARFWHGLRPHDGKAEVLGHFETTLGDYRILFSAAERVRAVTAPDVERVAASYFTAHGQCTVVARSRKRGKR